MKKLISSILVALIILSAVAAPAYAAEVDTVTLNDAVELACDVFPEYEVQIRGSNPIQKDFSRNADNGIFETCKLNNLDLLVKMPIPPLWTAFVPV